MAGMYAHLIPDSYRESVTRILQKTLDEHGYGSHPWGIGEKGNCSYVLGCGIGVSMKPEIAARADSSGNSFISALLGHFDATGFIAEDLFGSRELPPEGVVTILKEVQNLHDNLATRVRDYGEDSDIFAAHPRVLYREDILQLARQFGLELKTRE